MFLHFLEFVWSSAGVRFCTTTLCPSFFLYLSLSLKFTLLLYIPLQQYIPWYLYVYVKLYTFTDTNTQHFALYILCIYTNLYMYIHMYTVNAYTYHFLYKMKGACIYSMYNICKHNINNYMKHNLTLSASMLLVKLKDRLSSNLIHRYHDT